MDYKKIGACGPLLPVNHPYIQFILLILAGLQGQHSWTLRLPFPQTLPHGYKTRELGWMMSTIVQTTHQVWLSQSNLTEASRRTLRTLPVEPGMVFGSAAQEALERTFHAGQTRQQFECLRQMPPPSWPLPETRVPGTASRAHFPPPACTLEQRYLQRSMQAQTGDFWATYLFIFFSSHMSASCCIGVFGCWRNQRTAELLYGLCSTYHLECKDNR